MAAVKVSLCFVSMLICNSTHCHGKNASDTNLCPKIDDVGRCCEGHRKIKENGTETCTECVGFTGDDCIEPCPALHYGSRCSEKCNCTQNEQCNQFVGCLPIPIKNEDQNNDSFIPADDNTTHAFPYNPIYEPSTDCGFLLLLVIILSASQIIIVVFCMTTLSLKCCRLPPQQIKPPGSNVTEQQSVTLTRLAHVEASTNNLRTDNGKSGHQTTFQDENANGNHYQTVKVQSDALEFGPNYYDTSVTAERIRDRVGNNWSTINSTLPRSAVSSIPNSVTVTSNDAVTIATPRPYSFSQQAAFSTPQENAQQNEYFTLSPI